jgi:hypothetical protein
MVDKQTKEILNKFFASHRNRCLALNNWIERQMKPFSLITALKCIYDYSDGNFNEMDKIIEQITTNRKVRGRSQVYQDEKIPFVDIEKDENGNLTVTGYNPDKEPVAKGMRVERNPNIFKKGDDNQVKKSYEKIESNMYDIGKSIRELYPRFSPDEIAMAIDAVRRYSAEKKLGYGRVLLRLKKGKLVLDGNYNIVPKTVKEGRIIVIDESVLSEINDKVTMTEEKFFNGLKRFLRLLLSDPVNADTSDRFKANGLDRNTLVKMLIDNGIVSKKQRINDRDENGDFKTATMKTKYVVPKKGFDRKIKRLYIKLFEKNLPINEEDGGAAMGGATSAESSGQYSANAFPLMRRTMYSKNMDESTDTQSVGDYQYTVPFPGDKETLARKNGKGGSVSINFEGKNRKISR